VILALKILCILTILVEDAIGGQLPEGREMQSLQQRWTG
jgi:hypothetical protein